MIEDRQVIQSLRIGILIILLFVLTCSAAAQELEKPTSGCGEAVVSMQNPIYLQTTNQGIIVVELPEGWNLGRTRPDLFFILKNGDTYESARTLMYIRIEQLDVSLKQAVLNDIESFKKSCDKLTIEDAKHGPLLEGGCESISQIFSCKKQNGPYVDLVTIIAFTGSLLNIVLSADKLDDIDKHRTDYDFLLQHLTMIKSQK